MSDLTQYTEDNILDWIAGVDMPSAPSAIYLDLLDTGGSSVIASINSASPNRKAVTLGTTVADGAGRKKQNTNEVVFTTSSDSLGTVIAEKIALYDAATGGNKIAETVLVPFATINNLDPVKVAVGDYTIKID